VEFDLIARIRARVTRRDDVLIGIGDDAALLQVPPNRTLVVTMDTLNAGVHFLMDTPAADIGWKALAVNLSDLAAMGAEPAWCTLSLSLPEADPLWLDGFLDGFLALAQAHGVALVGGDTTRGPLSIAVTVHGLVEPGAALRRDGARAGDDVWVTGTLGDAAAALECRQRGASPCDLALSARLHRPSPRVATGRALAKLAAHAAIDLSDGLVADLAHICRASAVAAEVWLPLLPMSPELAALHANPDTCWCWQTSGGDDYELCFTAPADGRDALQARLESTGTSITRIGRIIESEVHSVHLLTREGGHWQPPRAGFVHFQSD